MSKITTLCYIRKDGRVLMLLRDKKEHDENSGKWIGVGGKLEEGESPFECVCRETLEETGLTLTDVRFRGIITFISDVWENQCMMLYEAVDFEGTLREDCEEGTLRWIPESEVLELPLWEGDRLFLMPMLETDQQIHMKLTYRGDDLVEAKWDTFEKAPPCGASLCSHKI